MLHGWIWGMFLCYRQHQGANSVCDHGIMRIHRAAQDQKALCRICYRVVFGLAWDQLD